MFSHYSSLNVKIEFLSHVVFEILAKWNEKTQRPVLLFPIFQEKHNMQYRLN